MAFHDREYQVRIPSPNIKSEYQVYVTPLIRPASCLRALPRGRSATLAEESSVILRDLGRQMQLKDRPMR
jgi:hypothetical protein